MPIGSVKYGMPQTVSAVPAPAEPAPAVVAPAAAGWRENPAVWLVGIAAVMFGLIGANTELRAGPVRASLGVGKA